MRSTLFLAMAALLPETAIRAQQPSTTPTDGLSCFEHLVTPEYPTSALASHVDGSVWTWIHVSPQGTPEKIDTQVVSAWNDGAKLLTPPVEKAIRASKIKPECAGKTVRAVFRYQYEGEQPPDPNAKPDTDGGYLMTIVSRQPVQAKASGRR